MYKYTKKLIITGTPEYTVLPSYIATKVRIYLDSIGIPYKMLIPKDFPEGVGGYDFLGGTGIIDAVAFETCIDTSQLKEIAEELDGILFAKDIAGKEYSDVYDGAVYPYSEIERE